MKAGNFPSVSYLKAPAAQDGHAGYSDPLDEQAFVTKVVNFLQQQPDWQNTAVIVTYDDSDGWYDHVHGADARVVGRGRPGQRQRQVRHGRHHRRERRDRERPLRPGRAHSARRDLAVREAELRRPHDARPASVVRFIEDNWLGGQRIGGGSFDATAGDLRALFDFTSKPNTTPLYLDPTLGTVLARRRRSDRYVVTAWPAQHAPAVSVNAPLRAAPDFRPTA